MILALVLSVVLLLMAGGVGAVIWAGRSAVHRMGCPQTPYQALQLDQRLSGLQLHPLSVSYQCSHNPIDGVTSDNADLWWSGPPVAGDRAALTRRVVEAFAADGWSPAPPGVEPSSSPSPGAGSSPAEATDPLTTAVLARGTYRLTVHTHTTRPAAVHVDLTNTAGRVLNETAPQGLATRHATPSELLALTASPLLTFDSPPGQGLSWSGPTVTSVYAIDNVLYTLTLASPQGRVNPELSTGPARADPSPPLPCPATDRCELLGTTPDGVKVYLPVHLVRVPESTAAGGDGASPPPGSPSATGQDTAALRVVYGSPVARFDGLHVTLTRVTVTTGPAGSVDPAHGRAQFMAMTGEQVLALFATMTVHPAPAR